MTIQFNSVYSHIQYDEEKLVCVEHLSRKVTERVCQWFENLVVSSL